MAPRIIYDLSTIDLNHFDHDIEEIRSVIPQRFEFEQLTGVCKYLPEEKIIVGIRQVQPDEFWVRGHIPGNPLLPGVLMLESAAQLCSFYCGKYNGDTRFFGFAAIDGVKFRCTVVPGDRLVLIGSPLKMSARRMVFYCQGVVREKLVFEAELTGVSLS